MAQTIVVQEQALNAAQARIADLEQRLGSRPAGGGFLFGGGQLQPRLHQPQPTMMPPGSPFGAPGTQGMAPGHGGGGFLAGAAQRAMAVAGGVLLGNMIAGAFGGVTIRTRTSQEASRTSDLDALRPTRKRGVDPTTRISQHNQRSSTMRLRDFALAAALSVLAGSATAQTTPATPEASPATPPQPQAQPGTTGATSATAPAPATVTRQLTVDAVEDMDLVASGSTDEIGDVEGVVESNADKKQFLLIERGGFLGIGAKKVAIPLENLTVQNDKLVLRNMSVAQLDGIAAFENENNAFRELEDSQQVTFSTQP